MKTRDLKYQSNKLYMGKKSIEEVAKKLPTPFYLYSEKVIEDNFIEFQGEAIKAKIPRPLICYALKANSNKYILKKLKKLGAGADIVSGGELKRAIDVGISPKKIVFSGVGKTKEEITLALKHEIYSFNVESVDELRLINTLAKKSKRKARICFRLNPVVNPITHKYISTGDKTHKFGLLAPDIMSALEDKSLWTNSKLVGLSIHIGSQLLDLKATEKAIKNLATLALLIDKKLEFLDVGGGLGVDYHPDEKTNLPSIKAYMTLVGQTLKKNYFDKLKNSKTRVVFEPGRRIIAKSAVLVMRVIRKKITENTEFVIVDGGMNDFMRPSLYGAYHHLLPVVKTAKKKRLVNIVGPICESSDVFADKTLFQPLENEDLLLLNDVGAYGYSMTSNYNLRGKPAELVVKKDGTVKTLTPAQKFSELS